MQTQTHQILTHLERYASITPLEALNLYGVFRLSGRIYELRGVGHPITKDMIEVKSRAGHVTRVAQYKLQRT